MKSIALILLLSVTFLGCDKKDNIDKTIDIKEYPLKHFLNVTIDREMDFPETLQTGTKFPTPRITGELDLVIPSEATEEDPNKKRIKSIKISEFNLLFKNKFNKKCSKNNKSEKCTNTYKGFVSYFKYYILTKENNKNYLKIKEKYEEEKDDCDDSDCEDPDFDYFEDNPAKYGGDLFAIAGKNHFKQKGTEVKFNIMNTQDIKGYYFNLDKYVIKLIYKATLPDVDTFIGGNVKFKVKMSIPLD